LKTKKNKVFKRLANKLAQHGAITQNCHQEPEETCVKPEDFYQALSL
jgi:hypothetical protein